MKATVSNIKPASHQGGFTLVELMLSVSFLMVISTAGGSLLRDYMATAKTLRIAGDANTEVMRVLRDLRRSFQTSQTRGSLERGCVLRYNGVANGRTNLNNYDCDFTAAGQGGGPLRTDGVGFAINADGKPGTAFVNFCEVIPNGITMPTGRGGLLEPPISPNALNNWGAANQVCPAACAAGQRPVIKFLTSDANGANPREILQRQIPKAITSPSDLNLWGGVICASYFRDTVRRLQGLFGENTGAFAPNYLSVTTFIARGRFDVLPPLDPAAPPAVPPAAPRRLSNYIWVHGGIVLEFNDAQEMSTYKCTAGALGC
jgi:type II secretory pathway pseudopilin PulG